jgi:hypothetical protein
MEYPVGICIPRIGAINVTAIECSSSIRIIKTYNPYTKILNFVLLIWEERNSRRYEHALACRERARAARAKKNPPALHSYY